MSLLYYVLSTFYSYKVICLEEVEEVWSEELAEDVEEIKKEVKKKREVMPVDEKFLDVSGVPSDSWEDWDKDVEDKKEVAIGKALAKEITRRFTLMRILKFLYKNHPEPLFTKEIAQGLKMSDQNLIHNLKRLVRSGVVERVVTSTIDLRTKYYQVADKKLTERLIRRYHWLVSFKFVKLIPKSASYLSVGELKRNGEFQKLCGKYYLSEEEAIVALSLNTRSVKAVFSDSYKGKIVGFRRKEQ